MDAWIEFLKALAALAGVGLAVAKMFFSDGGGNKSRRLEERRERIHAFLAAYEAPSHPMAVEASFAAAVGHTKISAIELPILLRQPKPTQFIAVYAKVQDYLQPNDAGTALELRSLATRAWLRNVFIWGGLLLYFCMVAATIFLGLYVLPDAIGARDWSRALSMLFYTVLFAASALIFLVGSSRLRWAVTLHKSQVRANDVASAPSNISRH